jgi:hypothetical protein
MGPLKNTRGASIICETPNAADAKPAGELPRNPAIGEADSSVAETTGVKRAAAAAGKSNQTGRHRAVTADESSGTAKRSMKRDLTPTLVNHGFGGLVMPRKRYKLLAVDLDGTLLDHDGVPHAQDVAALHALKASGIVVTIITGRLFSGTKPTADILGIDGPIGCADGSQVWAAGSCETLVHHTFTPRAGHLCAQQPGSIFVRWRYHRARCRRRALRAIRSFVVKRCSRNRMRARPP